MKNKNLIIGGVILAGIVAYYFYNKNKGSGLASSSRPIEPIVSTVSSNMPKWRLKRDVSSGRIPDNELIFKKGDVIFGEITKQSIGSKNGKGIVAYKEWSVIRAFPTVKTAKFNIEFPVNLDDLEEVR
jgi:hypothetical protein